MGTGDPTHASLCGSSVRSELLRYLFDRCVLKMEGRERALAERARLPDGSTRVFSLVDTLYMNACSDPFDDAKSGLDLSKARIPDWNIRPCRTVVRTCRSTVTLDANTANGVIKMTVPNTTANSAFQVLGAGADMTLDVITARTDHVWDQAQLTTSDGSYFRRLAAGMKVWSASPEDSTQGVLRGGVFPSTLTTAATPTYVTFADVTPYLDNSPQEVMKGITVRLYNQTFGGTYSSTVDSTVGSWCSLTTLADVTKDTALPGCTVSYTGCAAGQVLYVQVVEYLELSTPTHGTINPTSVSPYSENFLWMWSCLNDTSLYPGVVSGHSFTSFLRGVSESAWAFSKRLLPSLGSAMLAAASGDTRGAATTALGAVADASGLTRQLRRLTVTAKKKKKWTKKYRAP